MKHKAKWAPPLFLLGCAFCGAGVFLFKKLYRMNLKEYTSHALYMAVLDDEIARKELSGVSVAAQQVVFPARRHSLQYRYHLFLDLNQGKTAETLKQETAALERRLSALAPTADDLSASSDSKGVH